MHKSKIGGGLLLLAVAGAGFAQTVSAASNGVDHSATGSGHFTATFAPTGEVGYRNFSFSARERDGVDTGQAQINNRSQNVVAHMDIDCLNVLGNVAHMSGIVTRSSNPAEEGTRHRFAVQDNGEGAGAPPDLITTAPTVPANYDCENPTGTPNIPVENGNVQVR
jgi:hypothetical protein